MKENIILIKDIRLGCYSDDYEERLSSKGGFRMQKGATYTYCIDNNWANGQGFYYCGTHIILEKNIDWDIFMTESNYYKLIDRLKSEIES